MAKEILHHMERMLDLGPNAGFGVFDPLDQVALRRVPQRLPLARA